MVLKGLEEGSESQLKIAGQTQKALVIPQSKQHLDHIHTLTVRRNVTITYLYPAMAATKRPTSNPPHKL